MHSSDTTALPTISVIMPAYNAGRYIVEAICSMQAQTYPHWELLVIDDGSEDDTAEVIQPFLHDARIRYYRVSRIGRAAGVRNWGLQKAQGDFIAFLDADDLYEPDALALFAEHMAAHPECTAVYGFLQKMTEDGKPIPDRTPFLEAVSNGRYKVCSGYEHTWENILNSRTIHQMCFMARASLFKAIGPFNESLLVGEDFAFYIRMFLHDFNGVQFIPRYIYRYRTYPESICHDSSRFSAVLANQTVLFRHIFEELPLPPEAIRCRSEFIGRMYGYYARTRYAHRQMKQMLACVRTAWSCPALEKKDWFKYCVPIVVRSALGRLDTVLTQWYWAAKAALRQGPPVRKTASFQVAGYSVD